MKKPPLVSQDASNPLLVFASAHLAEGGQPRGKQARRPEGIFYRKQYPLMMAMWNSWSVNPGLIKARLAGAAKALGEVDVAGTINSVVANRRAAAERAAQQWNLYIRQ